MRQKLIKKRVSTALDKASKTDVKESARSLKAEKTDISLYALLSDPGLTREQWTEGLKAHSSQLSNMLLNDQLQELETYLAKLGKEADLKALSKNALLQFNHKALLQELLQLAVLIEHSTIPPYLTAMYSIKDGTNALPSQIIRSVAIEEMLHMIMVCNVLNAIDITPSVNKPQNYPVYPMKLPLNVDFYVNLEKFSTNSIATFIAIESPSNPTVKAPVSTPEQEKGLLRAAKPAPEGAPALWLKDSVKYFIQHNINTIGEFYDVVFFFILLFQILEYYKKYGKLPTTFKELNTGGLFTGDPALQIRPEQYYGSGGTLHPVEDLSGVIAVFQEIKGQGEGADGTIFYVDPSEFEEGAELAHYFRFKEVFHEHFYVGGNYRPFTDANGNMPVTTPPVGKPLAVDWNAAYPIKMNIKLADMQSNSDLYAQGKAFNSTYKKLLDAIQAAVEGNAAELEKSVMYMYALREQAIGLMNQPLTAQENAAPSFEYPVN